MLGLPDIFQLDTQITKLKNTGVEQNIVALEPAHFKGSHNTMKSILDHFPRIETTNLDDNIRSAQSGSFIRLPQGRVHYELTGPDNVPQVVLIPGFSIPYYLWDPTFKALSRAGLRVLRFDLFGRGYSDRPRACYDLPFFARQLSDLLYALQIHQPLHLVGVSMGGPICLQFAVDHPKDVKSVSLIDPAGFPPPDLYDRRFNFPLIGELLFAFQSRRKVLEGLEIDLFRPERFPEYVEQYLPQLRLHGSNAALLSTLRCGVLDRKEELYRQFRQTGVPLQLFWGMQDRTFPYEISREVLAILPRAEFNAIAGARHVPHYEYPEVVHPLMIDFIKRCSTTDK
jgi:pimeloyl-ACP methyl ester carboxylesterase